MVWYINYKMLYLKNSTQTIKVPAVMNFLISPHNGVYSIIL